MYFAENLKFLRKRLKKSQMELAAELDNGMHLMIGAYRETLDFIDRIGSGDKIEIKPLDIPFRRAGVQGTEFRLKSMPGLPGPLHLLPSLVRSQVLSFGELIKLWTALYLKRGSTISQ